MIVLVVGLRSSRSSRGPGRRRRQGGGLGGQKDLWKFLPEPNCFTTWPSSSLAAMTMMLGSIPQQDVFQRVMSANSVNTATRGPVIGGVSYILFAFVPMFIVASAWWSWGGSACCWPRRLPAVLPTFVLQKMPLVMQILFFGALLSAIKSTSSATLLAPFDQLRREHPEAPPPRMTDKRAAFGPCASRALFSAAVLAYAIRMQGTPIYDLVSGAYQVTLVGAFVPLVCGLYWRRRHHAGGDRVDSAGHRHLAAVPGHALGRRVPVPIGGCAGRVHGHGGRLAAAAVGSEHSHAAPAAGHRARLKPPRGQGGPL
jgi:SSS family solute:Na+ symporter